MDLLFFASPSKQRVDSKVLHHAWPNDGANLFLEHYDRVAPFFKDNMVLLYALHQTQIRAGISKGDSDARKKFLTSTCYDPVIDCIRCLIYFYTKRFAWPFLESFCDYD